MLTRDLFAAIAYLVKHRGTHRALIFDTRITQAFMRDLLMSHVLAVTQ